MQNLSNISARGAVRSGAFEFSTLIEPSGHADTPIALVIGSPDYYPKLFSPALKQRLTLAHAEHAGFARALAPLQPDDYALERVLADIDLQRAALGIERMILIGHSGHGYMALEYAKRWPERVSHLVLANLGISHAPEQIALAERRWAELVAPERKARLETAMAELPARLAAEPERRFVHLCLALGARSWADWRYDAAPLWQGVRTNMAAIDHLWGEAFRDIDIAAGLARLSMPVWLGLGAEDYLVPPPQGWDALRPGFADLTVRIFERAGHAPMLECPAEFDAALLDWLRIG